MNICKCGHFLHRHWNFNGARPCMSCSSCVDYEENQTFNKVVS